MRHLGGGPLRPQVVPPRPAQRGLHRRPTLVQNAETLAHLALVARHGGAWFRTLGSAARPGSALVTLTGAITRPGVYEIATGTPLRAVADAAGGTTEPAAGVLVGGYFGAWSATGSAWGAPLDATLGSGVLCSWRVGLPCRGAVAGDELAGRRVRGPVRPVRSRSRGHRRRAAGAPCRAPDAHGEPDRPLDGTGRGTRCLSSARRRRAVRAQRTGPVRGRDRGPPPARPVRRMLARPGAGDAERDRDGGMTRLLRVDPIACRGHGLCAELFPEGIALDDWGYPIILDHEVRAELVVHARRAVASCPALALHLDARADADERPAPCPSGRGAQRRRSPGRPATSGSPRRSRWSCSSCSRSRG